MSSLRDLIDEPPQRQPASCAIEVDGIEIDAYYPVLLEVSVDMARDKATEAVLVFETRRETDGSWSVIDDELMVPWAPITIDALFGSATRETVMTGYIRKIELSFPKEAGSAKCKVTCQDLTLPMDRKHERKNWSADGPAADKDILSQLTSNYPEISLSSDNGAGQSAIRSLNQDGTDIAFLRKRAEANGYELLFHAGELYFGPLRFDAAPQAPILVYAGRATNCISFDTEDDGHKPNKIVLELAKKDKAGGEEITVTSDLPSLGNSDASQDPAGLPEFAWRMAAQGGVDQEELEARAQAKANENALKVKATGELDGSMYGHVLLHGLPVEVDGVGDRYGGKYYVDTVNHRFDMNGYIQKFTLLRNAYGDNFSG